MQMTIEKGRESSIFYENKFYDTGVPIEAGFSEAFRMTRVAKILAKWPNATYDPTLFHEKHFFNFMGDMDNSSGFGGVSYNLVRHSIKQYQIALAGRFLDIKDPVIFASRNRELLQGGAMIWHDQPRDTWVDSPFKRNIAIIPFETTIIPHSWIWKINQFDALLVPCEQNKEAFQNSGVRVPIEVIHWGVDTDKFKPVQRSQNRPFTFGHMGALSVRKGTDVLIDAFQEAFPVERDVRLICKTSFNHYPFMTKDPRISVQLGTATPQEMENEFTKEIDCFVFPTRGEGFGLTPLEMMATGVPAIVTGWAGPVEYMTPEVGWTIDYHMEPATPFTEQVYKEECGEWGAPNKAHLVELMRHAYFNQQEVKTKGLAAAQYVQDFWTWEKKIGMFHEALKKHL